MAFCVLPVGVDLGAPTDSRVVGAVAKVRVGVGGVLASAGMSQRIEEGPQLEVRVAPVGSNHERQAACKDNGGKDQHEPDPLVGGPHGKLKGAHNETDPKGENR